MAFPFLGIFDSFAVDGDPIPGPWILTAEYEGYGGQFKVVDGKLRLQLDDGEPNYTKWFIWTMARTDKKFASSNTEFYFTVDSYDQTKEYTLTIYLHDAAATYQQGSYVEITFKSGSNSTWAMYKWNPQFSADVVASGTFPAQLADGDKVGFTLIQGKYTMYYKASAGAWAAQGTGYSAAAANESGGVMKVRVNGPFPAPVTNTFALDDFGGGDLPEPAVVDKAAEGGQAVTQTMTWLHAVAGANRTLLVGVGVEGSQTVQSVTFHGSALAYLGTANDSVDGSFRVEIWGLKNPDMGAAYEVLVTLTGAPSTRQIGASISLQDCDVDAPFGTVAAATGRSGTAPSVDVTDAEDFDEVVDFASCGEGFVSSNQIQQILANYGTGALANNFACSAALAASTVSMGYTTNNGAYAIAALRVKKRQNQDTSVGLRTLNKVNLSCGLQVG